MDKENMQEETIEIPPELEGVSPDIAAEIMQEVEQAKPDTNEQDEDEESDDIETKAVAEEKEEPAQEAGEEEASSGGAETKPPTNIPYARFREVNEEKKKLQEKLAAYEATQQKQLPADSPTRIPRSIEECMASPEFTVALNREARRRAQQLLGLNDEQIADFDSDYVEDQTSKRKWDAVVQTQTSYLITEAREKISQYAQETAAAEHARKAAYDEYLQLAEKISKLEEDDRTKFWAYTTGSYLQSMSAADQYALRSAYQNAESGQGSPQDIAIVKYHVTRAMDQFGQSAKPAGGTKTQKVAQMQKHPRTDQIVGDGDGGAKELTAAEIEKMLDDPNIDINQIPASWRKKLLV